MVTVYCLHIKMKNIYILSVLQIISFFIFTALVITKPSYTEAATWKKTTWVNWPDYLDHYPDYRQHKEPQDIAKNGCNWGTWVTFPNKIAAIQSKVGHLKDPKQLFESLDFIAMYRHPIYYYKHCIEYLSGDYTDEQKKIAIYALENLGLYPYIEFTKACYQLYKQRKLSSSLFQFVLCFELSYTHPLVKEYDNKKDVEKVLQQLKSEVIKDEALSNQIEEMLSDRLKKRWKHSYSSYYRYPLSIQETIKQANKELEEYVFWEPEEMPKSSMNFLMLIEHANCYLQSGNPRNSEILKILVDPSYSNAEKRLFIFAMHRLSYNQASDHKQSQGAYIEMLEKIYYSYAMGELPIALLEDVLHYPEHSKSYIRYPFYVMDYKSVHLQKVLDEFIALPTITCDWKNMAKKLKKGTLLSREEIDSLQGYKEFLKTHFILYETIYPQKEVIE
jgi:hypothetical protein